VVELGVREFLVGVSSWSWRMEILSIRSRTHYLNSNLPPQKKQLRGLCGLCVIYNEHVEVKKSEFWWKCVKLFKIIGRNVYEFLEIIGENV
jgi:hypothetical protein